MTINSFDIPNPEHYDCLIRNYNIGHSTLNLRVRHNTNPEDTFYIQFSSVAYFSGAIRWHGANFVIKPDDEMLHILRKSEYFDKFSDTKLLELPSYKLYEVKTLRDTIQIIARRGGIVQNQDIL